MTDPTQPSAADMRRAAVFLRHASPSAYNPSGVSEILRELGRGERFLQFVTALSVIAWQVRPDLDTGLLQDAINQFSTQEVLDHE